MDKTGNIYPIEPYGKSCQKVPMLGKLLRCKN